MEQTKEPVTNCVGASWRPFLSVLGTGGQRGSGPRDRAVRSIEERFETRSAELFPAAPGRQL